MSIADDGDICDENEATREPHTLTCAHTSAAAVVSEDGTLLNRAELLEHRPNVVLAHALAQHSDEQLPF